MNRCSACGLPSRSSTLACARCGSLHEGPPPLGPTSWTPHPYDPVSGVCFEVRGKYLLPGDEITVQLKSGRRATGIVDYASNTKTLYLSKDKLRRSWKEDVWLQVKTDDISAVEIVKLSEGEERAYALTLKSESPTITDWIKAATSATAGPQHAHEQNSRAVVFPFPEGMESKLFQLFEEPVGIGCPYLYRFEPDGIIIADVTDENITLWKTTDPERYLGFDPRRSILDHLEKLTTVATDSPALFEYSYSTPSSVRQRRGGTTRTGGRPGTARRVVGGFRFQTGGKKAVGRRAKNKEKSVAAKRVGRRGLARRIAAAKKWHRGSQGARYHRALGDYNRENLRSRSQGLAKRVFEDGLDYFFGDMVLWALDDRSQGVRVASAGSMIEGPSSTPHRGGPLPLEPTGMADMSTHGEIFEALDSDLVSAVEEVARYLERKYGVVLDVRTGEQRFPKPGPYAAVYTKKMAYDEPGYSESRLPAKVLRVWEGKGRSPTGRVWGVDSYAYSERDANNFIPAESQVFLMDRPSKQDVVALFKKHEKRIGKKGMESLLGVGSRMKPVESTHGEVSEALPPYPTGGGPTRRFYVATNDYPVLNHLVPHLEVGENEVTKKQADWLALALTQAAKGSSGRKAKVYSQNAQIVWDLFHDPYSEETPPWVESAGRVNEVSGAWSLRDVRQGNEPFTLLPPVVRMEVSRIAREYPREVADHIVTLLGRYIEGESDPNIQPGDPLADQMLAAEKALFSVLRRTKVPRGAAAGYREIMGLSRPFEGMGEAGTYQTHLRGKPYVRVTFTPEGTTKERTIWGVKIKESPGLVQYRVYTREGEMLDEIVAAKPGTVEEIPARMNLRYGRFEIAESLDEALMEKFVVLARDDRGWFLVYDSPNESAADVYFGKAVAKHGPKNVQMRRARLPDTADIGQRYADYGITNTGYFTTRSLPGVFVKGERQDRNESADRSVEYERREIARLREELRVARQLGDRQKEAAVRYALGMAEAALGIAVSEARSAKDIAGDIKASHPGVEVKVLRDRGDDILLQVKGTTDEAGIIRSLQDVSGKYWRRAGGDIKKGYKYAVADAPFGRKAMGEATEGPRLPHDFVMANQPDWTTVTAPDGNRVEVLRVKESRYVAVPVGGRRNAAKFDIIDLKAREHLTQLKNREVTTWLVRGYYRETMGESLDEGGKPTGKGQQFFYALAQRYEPGQEIDLNDVNRGLRMEYGKQMKALKALAKKGLIGYDGYNIFWRLSGPAEAVVEGINDPYIFKAVFLAGGPGSGKSFIAKQMFAGTGLKFLNSDLAFEYLLKQRDLPFNIDPSDNLTYAKQMSARGRAKELTKLRKELWLNGMLGLVVDGTGKGYDKISRMASNLKALGYDTSMVFVNTTLEVALQRNKERARSVPEEVVTQSWNAVQSNMGRFQSYFGGKDFVIVDNNKPLDKAGVEKLGVILRKKALKLVGRPVANPVGKAIIKTLKQTGGKTMDDIVQAQALAASRLPKFVGHYIAEFEGLHGDKIIGLLLGEGRNGPPYGEWLLAKTARLVEQDEKKLTPEERGTIVPKVFAWLQGVESPSDDEFHAWAESEGLNVDKAEAAAYDLAKRFVGFMTGGASKGQPPAGVSDEAIAKGTEVEREHVAGNDEAARKIAYDHLAEFPEYYEALAKMEADLEAAKGGAPAPAESVQEDFGIVYYKGGKPSTVMGPYPTVSDAMLAADRVYPARSGEQWEDAKAEQQKRITVDGYVQTMPWGDAEVVSGKPGAVIYHEHKAGASLGVDRLRALRSTLADYYAPTVGSDSGEISEVVSPAQKEVTKAVKAFFKKRGIKVRHKGISGKSEWVDFWVDQGKDFKPWLSGATLKNFPDDIRKAAVQVLGGAPGQLSYGNAQGNSIAMYPANWWKFLKLMGEVIPPQHEAVEFSVPAVKSLLRGVSGIGEKVLEKVAELWVHAAGGVALFLALAQRAGISAAVAQKAAGYLTGMGEGKLDEFIGDVGPLGKSEAAEKFAEELQKKLDAVVPAPQLVKVQADHRFDPRTSSIAVFYHADPNPPNGIVHNDPTYTILHVWGFMKGGADTTKVQVETGLRARKPLPFLRKRTASPSAIQDYIVKWFRTKMLPAVKGMAEGTFGESKDDLEVAFDIVAAVAADAGADDETLYRDLVQDPKAFFRRWKKYIPREYYIFFEGVGAANFAAQAPAILEAFEKYPGWMLIPSGEDLAVYRRTIVQDLSVQVTVYLPAGNAVVMLCGELRPGEVVIEDSMTLDVKDPDDIKDVLDKATQFGNSRKRQFRALKRKAKAESLEEAMPPWGYTGGLPKGVPHRRGRTAFPSKRQITFAARKSGLSYDDAWLVARDYFAYGMPIDQILKMHSGMDAAKVTAAVAYLLTRYDQPKAMRARQESFLSLADLFGEAWYDEEPEDISRWRNAVERIGTMLKSKQYVQSITAVAESAAEDAVREAQSRRGDEKDAFLDLATKFTEVAQLLRQGKSFADALERLMTVEEALDFLAGVLETS